MARALRGTNKAHQLSVDENEQDPFSFQSEFYTEIPRTEQSSKSKDRCST